MKCPECLNNSVTRLGGVEMCRRCGWRPPAEPKEKQVTNIQDLYVAKISIHRIVEFGGHWFIAQQSLDLVDDYYGAEVGDVIVVRGNSGASLFFELAGRVDAYGDNGIDGWMLIRIDPATFFDDLPTLDVNPEDATILSGDEEEKEGGSGD